ncbi:MAG: hypothetical protein NUW01_14275 [Gemmatimonadaceae bacterium]|nr:hypothetical protein [Gemmatimonadaceae bacterium]
MATDLLALQADVQTECGSEWERYFWQAVRTLAAREILPFILYVHGHEAPVIARFAFSRHGLVWARAMEENLQTLFVSPPEHAKTLLMRCYAEWWLGRKTEQHFEDYSVPPPTALYLMNAAEAQAEKQGMLVASTLESNERYREVFPHVKPRPKWGWTKGKLYLERRTERSEPSLTLTGLIGPYQGDRVGLAVVDDPTDQEDAYSETTMRKQIARHQGLLADRMMADGERRDIMTRWSRHDIPGVLIGSPRWHAIEMPCLGFWEAHPELWPGPGSLPKALWPEEWPEDRLHEKRMEKELTKDSELWQLAWMTNPVAAEGEMFKRNWLQYYQPEVLTAA